MKEAKQKFLQELAENPDFKYGDSSEAFEQWLEDENITVTA